MVHKDSFAQLLNCPVREITTFLNYGDDFILKSKPY